MTSDKIIEVFTHYQAEIDLRGINGSQLVEYSLTGVELESETILSHLGYMCGEAISHVENGRTEKAFRWLGFVQGVLWMQGIFTLDELKNHSRPDSE